MHDDHFDAHSGEKCDVSCHTCTHLRVCIIHKCAAVFDYKDGITKPLNVWERFKQHSCFSSHVEMVEIDHLKYEF